VSEPEFYGKCLLIEANNIYRMIGEDGCATEARYIETG
jgi:hypothetical protein